MCGLIFHHNFTGEPVNTKVLERFEAQRSRGTQGFGVFDGSRLNLVRHTTEDKIKTWVNKYPTDMLLFHHRFPTSTDNVKNACHPFTTRDYFGGTQYVFIHNGWLTNQTERKAVHEGMGIKYYSIQPDGRFNDSEALMWDIALYLEGRISEIEAKGSAAYIILKRMGERVDTVYFGRNDGAPLHVDWTKDGLYLGSTGTGWEAQADVLYTFDPLGRSLHVGSLVIPRGYQMYSYKPENSGNKSYKPGWWEKDHEPDNFATLKRKYGKKRAKEILRARRSRNNQPTLIGEVVSERKAELETVPNHIKDAVKKYLTDAKGRFEDAFWLCQLDIDRHQEELEANPNDILLQTDLRIAEGAMEVLVGDPEWNVPEAVSSMVGAAK